MLLRIHELQHRVTLADGACEEAVYDRAALRAFAAIDLGREPVPDATTICKIDRLREKRDRQTTLAEIGRVLQEHGLRLSAGTIGAIAMVAAPSSTENADQQRDPEMK